jgi:Ca2+-binding EF-hand superfamily protein
MYRQLYPHSKSDKFCARIFTIFDRNKDNFLDFEEFLRAIKITMSNNVKDKLKCAFEIYDLKGDGKIDKKEMKKILNHIYDMLGEDNKQLRHRSKFADKKVDLIFEKFDLDRDESLSLDEFISGCLRDEYLNHLFKSSFSVESTKSLSSESLALNDSNRDLIDKSSLENGEGIRNIDQKSAKFEILDHDDNKEAENEEQEDNKSIKLKYLNKIEVYK